jgi:glutamate synthase domain-containing protein 3
MKPIIVILCEVRVLATGMDGGHTYLAGRTDHPPHGIVDAYFDFEDRSREADFEARYV